MAMFFEDKENVFKQLQICFYIILAVMRYYIKGMEDDAFTQALGSFCPSVLFPYARETIDTIVIKGCFHALMLAPVNFDAVYAQAKAQAEAQANNIQ